jgi:hypothetical protein
VVLHCTSGSFGCGLAGKGLLFFFGVWCTGVLARCLLLRLRMVGVADDTAGLVWNSGLYVVDGMPATSY